MGPRVCPPHPPFRRVLWGCRWCVPLGPGEIGWCMGGSGSHALKEGGGGGLGGPNALGPYQPLPLGAVCPLASPAPHSHRDCGRTWHRRWPAAAAGTYCGSTASTALVLHRYFQTSPTLPTSSSSMLQNRRMAFAKSMPAGQRGAGASGWGQGSTKRDRWGGGGHCLCTKKDVPDGKLPFFPRTSLWFGGGEGGPGGVTPPLLLRWTAVLVLP